MQVDDVEAQMIDHVREPFAELDTLLRSASGIGRVFFMDFPKEHRAKIHSTNTCSSG